MPKSRSLSRYSGPRRWSEADARVVLAALQSSGLSAAAFAAREGLHPKRLYSWKRRLERDCGDAPVTTFVEVRPAGVEPIEVVLRSGQILRVPQSIDVSVVRRLVEALEQERAC